MQILHSRIIGEGKPLLILHGYFGSGDNWKMIGNKLANDFQVHLIDQRNHGRSFHSEEFDYELLVQDLYNYIQHHKLPKVSILGHSMGGKTVMLFAVEFSNLVDKLIVADIGPKMYPPHHQDILKALNSIDFSKQHTRKLVDEKIAGLIPEIGVRQFLLKNVYWKEKGLLDFRFNLSSLTEHNNEVGVGLPPFTVFDGETLFLKGENSGYITDEDASLIRAHFPMAKIITIANAGHWLHAENPIDFHSQVSVFLR